MRALRAAAVVGGLWLASAALGCSTASEPARGPDAGRRLIRYEAGGAADGGCTPGAPCAASTVCGTAAIACVGGVAACQDTGEKAPGTPCGTGLVCSPSGLCVACSSGMACTPASPCHTGALDCSGGAPVCMDTGAAAPGTSCGAGMVCSPSGTCVSCSAGAPCAPADPCQGGSTDCSTGTPVCNATGDQPAGTACPDGECDGAGRCATFFGAWEQSDPSCSSACRDGNRLDPPCAAPCSCAVGTAESVTTVNDCGGTGTQIPATIGICQVVASAGSLDWGGAYQLDDPVSGGAGCRHANPFTGGCSCPSGTGGIPLRTLVQTTGGPIGSEIFACWGSSAITFGGAYEQDDPVAGGAGCRAANPATGACSCPAGLSAQSLRVEVDGASGFIGSTIYLCER